MQVGISGPIAAFCVSMEIPFPLNCFFGINERSIASLQDGEGKTPLHDAVKIHRVRAIAMLLEAGADPALLDFKLMTPIHGAAGFGFLA